MIDSTEQLSAFAFYSQINKQNNTENKQNGVSNKNKRRHQDKSDEKTQKYKKREVKRPKIEINGNNPPEKHNNKQKTKKDRKINKKEQQAIVTKDEQVKINEKTVIGNKQNGVSNKNERKYKTDTKKRENNETIVEKVEPRASNKKDEHLRLVKKDEHQGLVKKDEHQRLFNKGEKTVQPKVNVEKVEVNIKQKEKIRKITENNKKTDTLPSKMVENGTNDIKKCDVPKELKTIDNKDKKLTKKSMLKKTKLVQSKEKQIKQKCSSGYFYIDNYNSVKTGEKMLKWILSPLDVNNFFKENWEKSPIIVQRNLPNYYNNILSCEDINTALRKQTFYFTKNIDITSYNRVNGQRETHNPPGRATAPLVWDYYSNGCSIRILNPQTFFPKIHALNAALQEYFGCFVGANVYLTPADSQGFAPHFDDIEAFVIQLEGEKLWKLYAPRTPSEVLPRFSSSNFTEADLGPPIQEVLLKAGDMMYFPRGFIHQGVALNNKHSLHITLSVYQKNSWADLLEILLPATLKTAIEDDVSFREGLPMHYLSHLGLVNSDKKSEIRIKFMKKFQELFSKLVHFAPVDAAVDQLGKKFVHDSLPPFLRHEEKETTVFGDGEIITNGEVHNQAEMCLATRIKLIRYNCIRMLQEDEAIKIYYSVSNSKEYHEEDLQYLEIDEAFAPAIDAIINSYPEYITVEDLPIKDDISKVQIASDLWENGILKTEYPLSYLSD